MYRHITPITEGTCPVCGSIGYLQEDDDSGETLYTAWCSNQGCRRSSETECFKNKQEAIIYFMKDSGGQHG